MASINRALFGDHRDPTEELTEIFGRPAAHPTAIDHAVDWAREVLDEAGVRTDDQVTVIATLRKAEPRLGLKTATYLAGLLNPDPPSVVRGGGR